MTLSAELAPLSTEIAVSSTVEEGVLGLSTVLLSEAGSVTAEPLFVAALSVSALKD